MAIDDEVEREREFMTYAHHVERLNLACDLLVVCASLQTWTAAHHACGNASASAGHTLRIIGFLCGKVC